MIWRLRSADIFGRFRAFWPATAKGRTVIVHSKTSIFDDRIARVGSANLNNRSGGFDTECELTVEGDDEASRLAIEVFRDRLVGHFMGQTGDAMAKARADYGGLVGAIDVLNREGRLRPIEPPKVTGFGKFVSHYHLGDPQDLKDSWNPARRRERLYEAVREMKRT